MANRVPYRHCPETGKRGYYTHRAANKVLHSMSNSAVLHAYQCSRCGLHHVGHILGWRRKKSAIMASSTADA